MTYLLYRRYAKGCPFDFGEDNWNQNHCVRGSEAEITVQPAYAASNAGRLSGSSS